MSLASLSMIPSASLSPLPQIGAPILLQNAPFSPPYLLHLGSAGIPRSETRKIRARTLRAGNTAFRDVCEPSLFPLTTLPLLTTRRGSWQMDVMPEFWTLSDLLYEETQILRVHSATCCMYAVVFTRRATLHPTSIEESQEDEGKETTFR